MTESKSEHIPKFKWWVTPLNIAILSTFFIIIDLVTGESGLRWAWWPILGIGLLYLMNLVVVSKPEFAWAVGPALFLMVSIFLVILERFLNNSGLFGSTWVKITVTSLLTFGTVIPTITHLGRPKKKAKQRFEEFRKLLDEEKIA